MDDMIRKLNEAVAPGRRTVFFGGAGVSTESGLPDFRSAGGIYGKQYPHPPEVMVSHSFFRSHPEEFFDFYRREMVCPEARPNAAHRKLAQMEAEGRLTAVITQNIDGLHQAAGSRRVLELHGSIHRNRCMDCGKQYGLEAVLNGAGVPRCSCGGIIKPEVVLYEEELDSRVLNEAVRAISRADTLIIGGTSLAVYPAAGLVRYFEGDRLVVINLSPTPMDSRADLLIRGKIGEVLARVE
ncbi:MAG: NAD-dependent protein deacylase [Clostridiales bacterium]|nr:NAD-dependent protein deacylase [Clostridiales bacterium]